MRDISFTGKMLIYVGVFVQLETTYAMFKAQQQFIVSDSRTALLEQMLFVHSMQVRSSITLPM